MPFSFETTIAIINNAANELSRAARDLGDERPDSDLTDKLRGALETMGECVNELTAERDRVAAVGTSGDNAIVLRDVRRDPNGMASPGADLPAGVTADTLEADRAALEDQRREQAERQRAATATTSAATTTPSNQPATKPAAQPATTAKPEDESKKK